MTDTWNCTATYDKAQYNKGETIKVTITGGLTSSSSTPGQSGTLTMSIAAGTSTTTIQVPGTIINTSGSTYTAGKITAVADTSGRTWTIAADGLSATAIA